MSARSPRTALAALLLVALPLLAACGGSGGGEQHSDNRGGVLHRPGLTDPLRNCSECHGAILRGGRGPSCSSCHSVPASHTAVRGTRRHNPAAAAACPACHGPNNTGGLGPACTSCHPV